MRYEECISAELKDSIIERNLIGIMAVGSIEQHGPHLPLCVDTIIPNGICETLVDSVDVEFIQLPPIFYGARSLSQSGGINAKDTTICVEGVNLINYFRDIFSSYSKSGLKTIVIVNGHYENESLLFEAAESISSMVDMNIIILSWWALISDEFLEKELDGKFKGWDFEHAGLFETSIMLHFRPDLVKTVNEESESIVRSGVYNNYYYKLAQLKNGVLSSAKGASGEFGEKVVQEIIRNFDSFIKPMLIF